MSFFSLRQLMSNLEGAKMESIFGKLVNYNKASFQIFIFGIVTQVITYPLLLLFGTNFNLNLNKQLMIIFGLFALLCFLIPIISIGAIIISIIQIRKRQALKFPIIGLVLNIIWFIVFVSITFMYFTVGQSV